MWIVENTDKDNSGKVVSYKFVERYTDEMTQKTKYVSVTFKDKKRKTQKMAEDILRQKIVERTQVSETIVSFSELGKMWYVIYKENVKASTAGNVKSRMRRIMKALGTIASDKIEPSVINKYLLDCLQKDNLRYSVVSNDKSIIIRILIFGMQYGFVKERNYKDLITIPALNKSKKDDLKYLEVEELESVIKQLIALDQKEIARMCQIQASTGMRYNEMVALDYKHDIDLENNIISITKNYDHHNHIFTTPKTGESRQIHINQATADIIKEQINYDKIKTVKYNLDRKKPFLFRQRNGYPRHIRYVNKILKNIHIENKKITTHIFRHTFITLMIQNNTKSMLVAEHVGHNSTKMIDQVYAHFTNQMDDELKSAIDSVKII
ncbi:MAG: tyrosine-type recombinase/integrase [Ruoffia tabacinasalis]|uniref:tyrosine-type recombinase/integrase n=1 Tax=Lactobacillales TaxID=186826 RepID=UPI00388AF3C5